VETQLELWAKDRSKTMNQSRFFHWLLPVLPDDSVLVVSKQNQSDIHSHSENNYNAVYLDGVLDLNLLKEVRRILKPEGTLLVCIKNNSFTYRFQLKSWLSKTGFSNCTFSGIEPDCKYPAAFIPANNSDALKSYSKKRHDWRLRVPAWLYKLTCSSFFIVSGNQPSRLDCLMDSVCVELGVRPPENLSWSITKKGKLVSNVSDGTASWNIKIPTTHLSENKMYHAHNVLEQIHSLLPAGKLKSIFPEPKSIIKNECGVAFVESTLPGFPVAELREQLSTELVSEIDSLATEFSIIRLPALPDPDFSLLISSMKEHSPDLLPVLNKILSSFDSKENTFLHMGDFTLSNILTDGKQITGLVDWDDAVSSPECFSNQADFHFSKTWHHKTGNRISALEEMFSVNPDMYSSCIFSCLTHAKNELQFDESRVESLLIEPCKIIGKHLNIL
jgi:hypothetical protein